MKKEWIERELKTQIQNPIKVHCKQCNRKTLHTIHASYEEDYHQIDTPFFSFDGHTNYQIIQCNGCEFISFREESWNSEDYEHYTEEDGSTNVRCSVTEKFFPNYISGSRFQDGELFHLPDTCRHLYLEIESALANQHVLLVAIGLRALMEAICEYEQQCGNIIFGKRDHLFQKIGKILEQGLLPKGSKDILHSIKDMGNSSAHEAKRQNIEHLKLAFGVLESLLRTLYIHTKQFNEIKQDSDDAK